MTASGAITLRGREVDGCFCFEVEDTGPGLPPGAEAQVFAPFVRLPEAKGKAGIGLGLATVKRLVEANGGEVGVASPPGDGARFWFTLPRPVVAALGAAPPPCAWQSL